MKKAEASYLLPLRLIYKLRLVFCRETEYFSMLGINPFTVLDNIMGKHQFADFAICICRIIHKDFSFLRINYRVALALNARK